YAAGNRPWRPPRLLGPVCRRGRRNRRLACRRAGGPGRGSAIGWFRWVTGLLRMAVVLRFGVSSEREIIARPGEVKRGKVRRPKRAHCDTAAMREWLASWNAGFIRQRVGSRGSLPDKSGVPALRYRERGANREMERLSSRFPH